MFKKNKYDLIIKKINYFSENFNLKEGYDLAIKNGEITKISKNINSLFSKKLNGRNCVAIPGYINTHIHFGEYYIKGYKNKLSTKEYIKYAEDFNRNNNIYKEATRKSSSLICADEALRYGQTTLVGIRGWDCLEKTGIRIYYGYPIMISEKLGNYLKNFEERYRNLPTNKLSEKYIFIHSLLTVNEVILKKVSEYIKNTNCFVALHYLETNEERKEILEKYKMEPIEVLKKYNLLSKKTLLVHCCYINERDIKEIEKYGCTISICPNSNLKLRNKVPSLEKLKKVNVCIGTDGVATNDSLNILNSCKTIALIQNISDKDVFRMITSNPASFLGKKMGIIKEGYEADISIYNVNDNRFVRKDTILNNLIYSSDILPKDVIIAGKRIIKNHKNMFYRIKRVKIKDYLRY